jgi:hypothetical protein
LGFTLPNPQGNTRLMATLHYADGRRAQLSCAMDAANHRHAIIAGTAGTIESEYLNHTSTQAGGHLGATCPVCCAYTVARLIPFRLR